MLDRALSHRKMSDALCTQSGAQGLVVSGAWHWNIYIRNEWMGLKKKKRKKVGNVGIQQPRLTFLRGVDFLKRKKRAFQSCFFEAQCLFTEESCSIYASQASVL